MSSALAVDHERGPDLPAQFRAPRREVKSPLPPEWSDGTKDLRALAERLKELLGDR
jgi:hypothetical protein